MRAKTPKKWLKNWAKTGLVSRPDALLASVDLLSVRNLLVRRTSSPLGGVVRHGGLVPYSCVRLRYPELCLARPLILRRRLQGYEVERFRWPTPTHWEVSQDWEWFFALLGGVELQLSPPQGEPLEETADISPMCPASCLGRLKRFRAPPHPIGVCRALLTGYP